FSYCIVEVGTFIIIRGIAHVAVPLPSTLRSRNVMLLPRNVMLPHLFSGSVSDLEQRPVEQQPIAISVLSAIGTVTVFDLDVADVSKLSNAALDRLAGDPETLGKSRHARPAPAVLVGISA